MAQINKDELIGLVKGDPSKEAVKYFTSLSHKLDEAGQARLIEAVAQFDRVDWRAMSQLIKTAEALVAERNGTFVPDPVT